MSSSPRSTHSEALEDLLIVYRTDATDEAISVLRITDYLSKLPSRSWLGKHIFDVVQNDSSFSHRAVEHVSCLWKSLIRMEELLQKVQYASLTKQPDSEYGEAVRTLTQCWDYCVEILKYSSWLTVHQNPAILRHPDYTGDKFRDLVITISFRTDDIRSRWRRVHGLILEALYKFGPLGDQGS